MRDEFRDLRLRQLTRSLSAFEAAKQETRPQRGWLRAIREGLGLSLENVGKRLGQSRRRIQEFEKAEAEDRITLDSLRRVAAALDCELVYAIIPKSGTITELAERRARAQATEDVLDVEHTMALENQATGNVNELIEEETKRRLKKQ
jgi:predicted DNA-binding mobile mystery protein A